MAQVAGRFDGQVFLKDAVRAGAVIILHELDFLGIRVVGLHEPVHKAGVIVLGFGARDLQMALSRIEVVGQQDVAAPFSYVLPCTHTCVGGINFGPMAQFGDLRLEKKARFYGPRFNTGTAWWCGNWPRTGPRR